MKTKLRSGSIRCHLSGKSGILTLSDNDGNFVLHLPDNFDIPEEKDIIYEDEAILIRK